MKKAIQNKTTIVYLSRVNLKTNCKQYKTKPNIQNMQKKRYTTKYIDDSKTLDLVTKYSKKSNIQFEIFPQKVKDSEIEKFIVNHNNVSEFGAQYLLQCAHVMSIVALKSIYTNSCNKHIYSLYCEVVKIAQEKDFDTFTGEKFFSSNLEEQEESGIKEDSELPDDLNGNDIIAGAFDCLFALFKMNMLTTFTDVWQYRYTVFSFINQMVVKERRYAENEDIDSSSIMNFVSVDEGKTILTAWKKVKPIFKNVLLDSSKYVNDEKADLILTAFELNSIYGYSKREIESKLNLSRAQVDKLLLFMKKYIVNSESILDMVKESF